MITGHIKRGDQLTANEVDQIYNNLVSAGTIAVLYDLKSRIRNCLKVVMIKNNDLIIAQGCIKQPNTNYKKTLFKKAKYVFGDLDNENDLENTANQFPYELGYMYVSPYCRNIKIGKRIIRKLFMGEDSLITCRIFATVSENNIHMNRLLTLFNFSRRGIDFQSNTGGVMRLWIKLQYHAPLD